MYTYTFVYMYIYMCKSHMHIHIYYTYGLYNRICVTFCSMDEITLHDALREPITFL
jgi:hypothetical protein